MEGGAKYSHRTPIMNRSPPLPGQVKCGFETNSVCPILEADGSSYNGFYLSAPLPAEAETLENSRFYNANKSIDD